MDYLKNIVVVDVETTGLDPQHCSILSVGMCTWKNNKLQEFYAEYKPYIFSLIEDSALEVNGFKRNDLQYLERNPDEVYRNVRLFMEINDCHTIAGMNPRFDLDFINNYARFSTVFKYNYPIGFRTLDLHSVCIANMLKNNISIPSDVYHNNRLSTDAIYKYVGLIDEPKPHNALTGAKMEFEAFCRLIYGHSVLTEYEKYPYTEVKTPKG